MCVQKVGALPLLDSHRAVSRIERISRISRIEIVILVVLVIIVITVTKVIMASILKVVIKDRCVFKKWALLLLLLDSQS